MVIHHSLHLDIMSSMTSYFLENFSCNVLDFTILEIIVLPTHLVTYLLIAMYWNCSYINTLLSFWIQEHTIWWFMCFTCLLVHIDNTFYDIYCYKFMLMWILRWSFSLQATISNNLGSKISKECTYWRKIISK